MLHRHVLLDAHAATLPTLQPDEDVIVNPCDRWRRTRPRHSRVTPFVAPTSIVNAKLPSINRQTVNRQAL